MTNAHGLLNVLITGEHERWDKLVLEAEPAVVTCPLCASGGQLSDPKVKAAIRVADTPARGKPVEILFTPCRYHCRRCSRAFDAVVDAISPRRRMTHRLIRYIENQSLRRTRSSIAVEIGVSEDRVRRLVIALADRLAKHHKFPTPRVLGIDDIRLNKKRHTIFTDAETGHAVGLVPAVNEAAIGGWLHENVDADTIEVIVSDMDETITSAVAQHLPGKLHVADPWHVIRGYRRAIATVMRVLIDSQKKEAAALREAGIADSRNAAYRKQRALKAARRHLVGRKRQQLRPGEWDLFDARPIESILADHPSLSCAFFARINLMKMYRADDEAAGADFLHGAIRMGQSSKLPEAFHDATKRLLKNERRILNFFEARRRYPDIAPSAFTTSSTERRNGSLRSAWRAGRGVTRPDYLRLLALYQPWQLDVDIVECGQAGCQVIQGPVTQVRDLIGQDHTAVTVHPSSLRCRQHA